MFDMAVLPGFIHNMRNSLLHIPIRQMDITNNCVPTIRSYLPEVQMHIILGIIIGIILYRWLFGNNTSTKEVTHDNRPDKED